MVARDGTNRGRPTDLTPEIEQAFCDAIEKGVPIRYACALSGVGERTYHGWIEKADRDEARGDEDTVFMRFKHAVTRARASKTRRLLAKLESYSDEVHAITGMHDPKTVLWLLERTEQQDFSPKQKTELSGPDGGPVKMTLADLMRAAAEADEKDDDPEGES